MTTESAFIDLMRQIAQNPAARGLSDDAAVLPVDSGQIILTHDAMVSGTHFFSDADPADVAWKLVAVNLSDLAAKGAEPLGVLLGYTLAGDDWDAAFAAGLGKALAYFDVPLLGGDTVSDRQGAPRSSRHIGLTAIGRATSDIVPSRGGARDGDALYVSGPIGAAYAGYCQIRDGEDGDEQLRLAFLRPQPMLAEGQALASHVTAMMDISDGLLLDASRMAKASGLCACVELADVPLDTATKQQLFKEGADGGDDTDADSKAPRLNEDALTFGDDYQLLFAMPPDATPSVQAWRIGSLCAGQGLHLTFAGKAWPLPQSLGFEHS